MATGLKKDLTPDEINQYWTAYFAAVDTLIVVQAKLEELEKKATDLGERSGYRADRLRVEADIELLRAKRLAFNANRSPINPPDQSTVDEMLKLATEVSKKTATRTQAATIVNIGASAMSEFNKIQTK